MIVPISCPYFHIYIVIQILLLQSFYTQMNINYPTGARKYMNSKPAYMVEETINSERKTRNNFRFQER